MIFDQYQRYKIIQILVKATKQYYNIQKLNILEIGSNEQLNLGKFLKDESITYSDIIIPNNMDSSVNFIQADATNLKDIKDGQYDIVLSLDVFEHIPNDKRESFLKETNRVCRLLNIHSFPFDSPAIVSAELRANEYYKSIFGKDHIWLEEHIQNGLPNISDFNNIIDKMDKECYVFEHGDILIWENMMKSLFFTYYVLELEQLREKIEDFYQQSIFNHDIGTNNYRKFLIMSDDLKLNEYLENCIQSNFDNKLEQRDLDFLYRNIDDMHYIAQLPIYREKLDSNVSATLYIDNGNGFNEDSKITCDYKIMEGTGVIDIYTEVPNNIKKLRFDPIEGRPCVLADLNIVSNDGILESKLLNGNIVDNFYVFSNYDPQLLVNLENKLIKWIKIQGRISTFENPMSVNILNELCSINKKNKDNILVSEQLKMKLTSDEALIESLNKDIIKIENYKENIDNELSLVISENHDLTNKLYEMQSSYEEIANSTCWKITKPLRKTLDLLKHREHNGNLLNKTKSNDIVYNIDKFSYTNNVFSLDGWIFNVNKKINNVTLLFFDGNQEHRINILSGLERKDVYSIYQNENCLYCGFSSKIKVENVKKLFVYLEIDNEQRVLINKIIGSWREQIKFYKKKLTRQNMKKIGMLIKNKEMKRLKDVTKRLIIEPIDDSFESINLIELKKDNTVNLIEYPQELYDYTIDIIIPVYNGYEYLEKLFNSIHKTKMKYRLIVINDKSPDERVGEFLKEYDKSNDIILLENEVNLGFVKSVNKAFGMVKNHVALVNTDVEFPDMWLERLMLPIILNKNIASSTPFTNCGTICSFPKFCQDNLIFENLSVDDVDKEFQTIKPKYTELPTGVGFCMGVNKNVLDKIGVFDDDTFAKGYGEENDWCQRAIKAGYKNVHVENLYIYHKHGGSFLNDQKKKLIERNSVLLAKKHPNYNSDVANFCSSDPVKNIRNYAIFKILSTIGNGILLYFDHNIGGGATSYLKNNVNRNIANHEHVMIIRYDIGIRGYLINYKYKEYDIPYYCIKLDELFDILHQLNIKNIYVNELVTYPNLYNILEEIIKIKEEKTIKTTMLLHDFFAICPTINLLNDKGCYCDIPDKKVCDGCLKNNVLNHYFDYENINKWRDNWEDFLRTCDEIIVFSENSKILLERSYSSLTNINVKQHSVNYMVPLNKQYKYTESLNVGLMGTLNQHKGINIIKQMLNIIDESKLDINIILIGSTTEQLKHKNFKQTGVYTTDMIPKLVLENDIDLFFISSICPETFSYTTQEIINMNIPIVSFDLGAPAERIRKYDKGLVLEDFDEKYSLEQIIDFSKKIKYKKLENDNRVLFVAEYLSFSSRYRVEHFQEQLLINGIESDFVVAENLNKQDLNQYKTVVIYRCRYNSKINKLIDQCHEKGKKVFYDIDDYIFDYNKIKNLEFLTDEEYSEFEKYSLNVNKCMQLCDGYLTSTENMKKAIKSEFKDKPVCVNRNVASMEMMTISLKAKNEIFKDKEKVIIGYFSGSKTHDNDFKIISCVLLKILKENKNIHLKIGGCLTLPKEFDEVKQQIEFFEFVDWKRLPYLIASIDINLLPVEDTFFHSCKSENKWTEAALVGVPTVASNNSELEKVVNNGENGLLCRNESDWENNLQKLINDYSYRIRMGENAHKFVLDNYITINSGVNAIKFIN